MAFDLCEHGWSPRQFCDEGCNADQKERKVNKMAEVKYWIEPEGGKMQIQIAMDLYGEALVMDAIATALQEVGKKFVEDNREKIANAIDYNAVGALVAQHIEKALKA